MDLPSLSSSFCNLIAEMKSPKNYQRFTARINKGRLPTPHALMHRAFFFSQTVHARVPTMFFDQCVTQPHPYREYWLVYRTGNGPLGYLDNAIHVTCKDNRVDLDFYSSMNSVPGWTVGTSVVLRQGEMTREWFDAQPLIVREYLPEFALTLAMIVADGPDHIVEREESTPDALTALNDRRERQGKRPLPPFITINHTPRPETIGQEGEGGGWTQRPHHRRGHWRTYKRTGKRVWVRDHAIHGGTDTPRHYLV